MCREDDKPTCREIESEVLRSHVEDAEKAMRWVAGERLV